MYIYMYVFRYIYIDTYTYPSINSTVVNPPGPASDWHGRPPPPIPPIPPPHHPPTNPTVVNPPIGHNGTVLVRIGSGRM